MCWFLTAHSDDFLKEYLLIDIITETRFAFSEAENEFLYCLEEIRELWIWTYRATTSVIMNIKANCKEVICNINILAIVYTTRSRVQNALLVVYIENYG
jgi:hypothetical protein